MRKATIGLCECGCGEETNLAPQTSTRSGWVKGQPMRFIAGHQHRGRKHSAAWTEAIVLGQRNGKKPVVSAEARARIAAAAAKGPRNAWWKGDNAGYAALHQWVARWGTKTGCCSKCGNRSRTHWANVSGEYRRDLGDFVEMCSSCHKRFDLARASCV